ncbi:5812_t:CDS:1, partial [Funneliformis geosporum]
RQKKQPKIISLTDDKYDEDKSYDISENFLGPKGPNTNNIINFEREDDTHILCLLH